MQYKLNIDWAKFLAEFWQKKPVILKQALTCFQDPISPDELAGLAMENEVCSRLVQYKNGNWQADYGPFEKFDHLGETQWSLLVQAVNHWHHPCLELVKPFKCMPQWRFDDLMISYSVPGGGVGPHIDNYDVFIIQGMGKRHWRVGDNKKYRQYCPHPALLHVVDEIDPIIDEDLLTGDILYIPPGFPHDGYSIDESLSYSIGFRAPNAQELMSGFADYLLDNDLGKHYYTDPELKLPASPNIISAPELLKVKTLMLSLLEDKEIFQDWFGQFISQSRHELDVAPAEPQYQEEEVYDLLMKGERLQRLPGIRIFDINGSGYINGEYIDVSSDAIIELLSKNEQLDSLILSEALYDTELIQQLTYFINKGYWYFMD